VGRGEDTEKGEGHLILGAQLRRAREVVQFDTVQVAQRLSIEEREILSMAGEIVCSSPRMSDF